MKKKIMELGLFYVVLMFVMVGFYDTVETLVEAHKQEFTKQIEEIRKDSNRKIKKLARECSANTVTQSQNAL